MESEGMERHGLQFLLGCFVYHHSECTHMCIYMYMYMNGVLVIL